MDLNDLKKMQDAREILTNIFHEVRIKPTPEKLKGAIEVAEKAIREILNAVEREAVGDQVNPEEVCVDCKKNPRMKDTVYCRGCYGCHDY